MLSSSSTGSDSPIDVACWHSSPRSTPDGFRFGIRLLSKSWPILCVVQSPLISHTYIWPKRNMKQISLPTDLFSPFGVTAKHWLQHSAGTFLGRSVTTSGFVHIGIEQYNMWQNIWTITGKSYLFSKILYNVKPITLAFECIVSLFWMGNMQKSSQHVTIVALCL